MVELERGAHLTAVAAVAVLVRLVGTPLPVRREVLVVRVVLVQHQVSAAHL
jgi:hypothetical protein